MATQSTDTRTFDDLFTTTFENVASGIQDNIYESNAVFAKLNEAGNIQTFDGGTELHEPIITAENDSFASYSPGGTFDTTEQEQFSRAQYQIRFVGGTIVWNREDERRNSGESAMENFVSERINAGTAQMKQELNKQLLALTKGDANDIDGIPLAISNAPTTSGSYGSFDGSTDSFWVNQATSTSTTWADLIKDVMTMSVNCQLGASGAPDFYLTDPTTWTIFAGAMQNSVRIGDKLSGNLGFDSIQFRGAPMFFDTMVPDPANSIQFPNTLTNGTVYALNSNAMKLKVDKLSNIAMLDLQVPTTQPTTRVRPIVWYGNLCVSERRALGVHDTITLTIVA